MGKARSRRVVFTFDERSLDSLERLTEQGQYPSMAETVREALRVSRAIHSQAAQGFTEVIVRNPKTNEQRVIVVPVSPTDS
jgi:Arc/MetJ-type ribon-helix-helix transcriptional regulator